MATPALAPRRFVTGLDHLREMLARQHAALLAHEAGARAGEDADELRRFRVATRRLRALLRAARPLLEPEWGEALRSELAWLAGSLGPTRDLDVLLAHVREVSAHFEPGERFVLARMLRQLEEERSQTRAVLLAAFESPRYGTLLERLGRELRSPRGRPTDVSVQALAAAEFRRLRKAGRALGPAPSDAGLHDLRLRVKRARYAAELAERAAGAGATAFIRSAKALQDVLGEHQDAAVAEERIRKLLRGPQSLRYAVAAGRLIERQYVRRERAREAFPGAWAALDKGGRSAWAESPPIRR
jgi:CHAD domain-containing protein